MRLIEIQEGVCINTDKIEGIKQTDGKQCEVYVGTRTYLSTLPYDALRQLLQREDMVDATAKGVITMEKLNSVLDKAQHWVG